MPIRRWINWDQQSSHDNLWELAEFIDAQHRDLDRQRHFNEVHIKRRRERRLRLPDMKYPHA